jgi:hypothetical protein
VYVLLYCFVLCCAVLYCIVTGVPQRELLAERAELLYGKAKFKPLQEVKADAGPVLAAAVPAGAASA